MRTPREGERGSYSVEAIMVLPALLVIIFAIIQGAAFMHAGNIAQAAAQTAYEQTRQLNGTVSDGISAGLDAANSGGEALAHANVNVTRTATDIDVTVTGEAPSILPWIPLHVERSITGPVERWVE
ncbi:TadE/TadG family type IV pilus assembly protein [Pseudoclavibacter sp. AY1H1]|uniref:TadE/TadG family type IV pilus assembly protein n=1 Tax=Pseudoclavibacter sp. AY1H1 TaxID=2080584 RepID=UPI000CE754A3|nr:TadE family protein [Pseudoclavibacter sp. AY1H1]PPF32661.1 TadE protein [Pseudoclavibacter sp. AY1H1]